MPELLNTAILKETKQFVQETLEGDSSGHDWWHIHRVRSLAITIGKKEDADLFIVELAALLHDIADHKFHDGDDTIGPDVAGKWLSRFDLSDDIITHVCSIVQDVSYKGAKVATPMQTLEGKIVQDADRLDAIGAIGIARAFAYGGHKGRSLHDPGIQAELHSSFEVYKKGTGPTINHFYEKLFLLKDRMNTASGREIARNRHEFMEQFVATFLNEWDGSI
ncbi:MAG: HD domain-containing protein [Bacteroidota bacterium]